MTTPPPLRTVGLRRRFHISDILSVVTGRVVSQRGARGVDALLRYMAGHSDIDFEVLVRYETDFRDALLAAYPDLGTVDVQDVPPQEFLDQWLRRRAREFGAYRAVPLLPREHPLRASDGARRDDADP